MKKRNTLWIAVLVLLFLSLGVGGVAAKYVRSRENIGVAKALEFYLTSNMLPGDHSLAPGTQSVSFTVGNYADDLRHAEMDITVTVTVDNGAAISPESFTLTKNQKSEQTVTITGLENGKTYNVTVTGNGGYVKTLTGTFTVLSPETGPFYFVEDKVGYTEVTIWCRNYSGTVYVQSPVTAIPDNTNPDMASWKTADTANEVTLGQYTSYRFQFFETKKEDIKVTTDQTGNSVITWKQPE